MFHIDVGASQFLCAGANQRIETLQILSVEVLQDFLNGFVVQSLHSEHLPDGDTLLAPDFFSEMQLHDGDQLIPCAIILYDRLVDQHEKLAIR